EHIVDVAGRLRQGPVSRAAAARYGEKPPRDVLDRVFAIEVRPAPRSARTVVVGVKEVFGDLGADVAQNLGGVPVEEITDQDRFVLAGQRQNPFERLHALEMAAGPDPLVQLRGEPFAGRAEDNEVLLAGGVRPRALTVDTDKMEPPAFLPIPRCILLAFG